MSPRARRLGFAAVFLIVNLHQLRNLIGPIYLAAYGLICAWALMTLLFGNYRGRLSRPGATIAWCVVLPFIGLMSSFATISAVGAITGLSRFIYAMPILLAFTIFTDDVKDLRSHATTMVAFFAIACASIPIQIITGPIPWFASASERGGLDRYASLIGSLTSLGIAVGCYVILSNLARPLVQTMSIGVMTVSAAMSLSKSAIANLAFGFLGILVLSRHRIGRIATAAGVMVVVAGIAWSSSSAVRERASSTLSSFGIETGVASGPTYDATVEESIIARLTELPLDNFNALAALESPLVYLTGGGFGMASTALVPPADSLATMAHNQFAEFVTVFGAIGALICLAVLTSIWRSLRRQSKQGSALHTAAFLAFGLLMINSLFANGTVYQPASASVFYAVMFIAFSTRLRVDTNPSQSQPQSTTAGRPPVAPSREAARTPQFHGIQRRTY